MKRGGKKATPGGERGRIKKGPPAARGPDPRCRGEKSSDMPTMGPRGAYAAHHDSPWLVLLKRRDGYGRRLALETFRKWRLDRDAVFGFGGFAIDRCFLFTCV